VNREFFTIWGAAIFCAAISAISFVGTLDTSNLWFAIFFGFLPLCFVFLGKAMSRMNREVQALREKVSELADKVGVVPPGDANEVESARIQYSLAWFLLVVSLLGIAIALLTTIVRQARLQ
jgi:hypothetical protein